MGDLGSIPGVGKIPWRRERLFTPVFWPGEFHGLYSPWGCKEWTGPSDFHLSVLHMVTYVFPCYSPNLSLSFLCCVHSSVLYVFLLLPCKEIQRYHFSRYHVCINIQYLFFSFCITGPRFIHLTRTDSKSFLFMAQ